MTKDKDYERQAFSATIKLLPVGSSKRQEEQQGQGRKKSKKRRKKIIKLTIQINI